MGDKHYISGDRLTEDSFVLGRQVYDSGFKPDYLIALWRGGATVGICVHEILMRLGVNVKHTIIKAKSYAGIEQRTDTVEIENLDFLRNFIGKDEKVLLVDDIFDSGMTVKRVRESIEDITSNLKVATPYYKPANSPKEWSPDFYVHETDKWIVFPHEIEGLSAEELLDKSPMLHSLIYKE